MNDCCKKAKDEQKREDANALETLSQQEQRYLTVALQLLVRQWREDASSQPKEARSGE